MIVDHPTLKLASGFVTVASGLFLMTHWWRDRQAWSAFWWALANVVAGIGITAMAAHDIMPGVIWQIAAPLMIGPRHGYSTEAPSTRASRALQSLFGWGRLSLPASLAMVAWRLQ